MINYTDFIISSTGVCYCGFYAGPSSHRRTAHSIHSGLVDSVGGSVYPLEVPFTIIDYPNLISVRFRIVNADLGAPLALVEKKSCHSFKAGECLHI